MHAVIHPSTGASDSICYMSAELVVELREASRSADELHEQSRRMLVDAARAGAAAGLTQRQMCRDSSGSMGARNWAERWSAIAGPS
jgi:hypothetical protein